MGAKAVEVVEVPLAQHVIECRRKWRRLRRKLAAHVAGMRPGPVGPPALPAGRKVRFIPRGIKGEHRGVVPQPNGRFRAQINIPGTVPQRTRSCGTYDTAEEAARAWDRAATEYGFPAHALNFPPSREAS